MRSGKISKESVCRECVIHKVNVVSKGPKIMQSTISRLKWISAERPIRCQPFCTARMELVCLRHVVLLNVCSIEPFLSPSRSYIIGYLILCVCIFRPRSVR